MRILLALPVLLILGMSSFGISFAQTAGPQQPQQQLLGIYAQVVITDSSGNLVSYLETSNVRIGDPTQFNQIIDENMGQFKKTVVSTSSGDVEILQVNDTLVHQSPTIVSLNLISLKTPAGPKTLVVADHDGFPVVPGDRMTTYWTIVRTAAS